jgi:hypothetical protein
MNGSASLSRNLDFFGVPKLRSPLSATQQLRGPADTWWGNFVAVQPTDHQITWDEFKLAFREHYIPEGVLHTK